MTPPKPQPNALIQQKRTVRDLLNSDSARAEIAKVLPKHLTPERMTRVALTAAMRTPALLNCQPESLMNALLVCSQAGLEPDGRLAHLIPFGNQVQVIIDFKGLVTLALRNGAEAVYADKVCDCDEFETWVENGDKKLKHKVNWRKPRGEPYCYYAVCKRKGQSDYEVMTLEEVQSIRDRSRAAKSGPWVTDFDEMAKKTVLRRMSKRWDLLPEIGDVINADDDTPPPIGATVASRPVFTDVQHVENGDELPTEPPRSEPLPPKPEPAQTTAFNPVKAVRLLCKDAKIKETLLIGFLAEIGLLDQHADSLEQVELTKPGLLTTVTEQWKDMSAKILAATQGQ